MYFIGVQIQGDFFCFWSKFEIEVKDDYLLAFNTIFINP
jgi:hypothetical protein